MTYAEQFDSAMKCTTKEEALHWLLDQVFGLMLDHSKSSGEALRIIRSNLGYMAGYHDQAALDKVHELFGAEHPIFGTTLPTPEEAFRMGQEWAAQKEKKP